MAVYKDGLRLGCFHLEDPAKVGQDPEGDLSVTSDDVFLTDSCYVQHVVWPCKRTYSLLHLTVVLVVLLFKHRGIVLVTCITVS